MKSWNRALRSIATNTARIRTVALFPLMNLAGSGQLSHLATSIPNSLSVSLVNTGVFTVLPKDRVSAAASGRSDLEAALAAGRQLSADIVIIGSYHTFMNAIDINLEAVDVKTARVVVTEGSRGKTGIELFDIIEALSARMVKRMTTELPPLDEYRVEKNVVRVEDVYINDLRKDHKFVCGIGYSEEFVWWPNDYATFGTSIRFVGGYGYGPIFFEFSGAPQFIGIDSDYVSDVNVRAGWHFIAETLAVRFDFHFPFTFTLLANVLWTPVKRLTLSAGAGYTFATAMPDLRATGVPNLKAGVEWLFLGEYGIRVEAYFGMYDLFGELVTDLLVTETFIMRFDF